MENLEALGSGIHALTVAIKLAACARVHPARDARSTIRVAGRRKNQRLKGKGRGTGRREPDADLPRKGDPDYGFSPPSFLSQLLTVR